MTCIRSIQQGMLLLQKDLLLALDYVHMIQTLGCKLMLSSCNTKSIVQRKSRADWQELLCLVWCQAMVMTGYFCKAFVKVLCCETAGLVLGHVCHEGPCQYNQAESQGCHLNADQPHGQPPAA